LAARLKTDILDGPLCLDQKRTGLGWSGWNCQIDAGLPSQHAHGTSASFSRPIRGSATTGQAPCMNLLRVPEAYPATPLQSVSRPGHAIFSRCSRPRRRSFRWEGIPARGTLLDTCTNVEKQPSSYLISKGYNLSPISNPLPLPGSKFRPLGKSFLPSFAPVPPSGYKATPFLPRPPAEVATRRKRRTPSPDCRKTKGCERGREGRSTAAAPPLGSRPEKKRPSPDSGPSPQPLI
jgi:hypothetical protein